MKAGEPRIGERFNRLVVEKDLGKVGRKRKVECVCDCGTRKSYIYWEITSGRTKSCGCLRHHRRFEIPKGGERYGHLEVIRSYVKGEKMRRRRYVECRCDCGVVKELEYYDIASGKRKSCGCRSWEEVEHFKRIHGLSGERLYGIWKGMIERCENERCEAYRYYGGRGIKVCREWKEDLIKFYEWSMKNGYKEELQIDRINNDGNYEPGNCRYVTARENGRNKSNNVIVTAFGEEKTLVEWSEDSRCVVSYGCLWKRIKNGMELEEAMSKKERIKGKGEKWSKERRMKKTRNIYEAFGERKGIVDWSEDERCVVRKGTLVRRIQRGWETEKAIITKEVIKRYRVEGE